MRQYFHLATAIALVAMLPTPANAADREWKTAEGAKFKLYDHAGTRRLHISFDAHDPNDDGASTDAALEVAVRAVAQIARDQSSDVFAITNMYCSASRGRMGCAVEGAWLKPGETIVTRAKDNKPVYFSTAAVLAGFGTADPLGSIKTRDGLTGKVDIQPSPDGPGDKVWGAK